MLWPDEAWLVRVDSFSWSESLRHIANQVEHHRRRSFQDEYLALLRSSGVDFDERYLW